MRFFAAVDPSRLSELSRRSQQVLLIAGATGVLIGLVVAGFEHLVAEELFERVLDAPIAVQAALPAVGLLVARLCLRLGGEGATPATSDDYIRAFHDPARRLPLRVAAARLAAASATLGSGSPLGYEGPSLYAGATVGANVQRRLARFFTQEQSRVLLVAGAAAGVSAIFKAPVTGLVFALEVPYVDDLARRMLLPAAISSAASYVTFVAFVGTDPILPVAGEPPFNLVDLGGAAVVGLAAGLFARAFALVVAQAKRAATWRRPILRALGGGAVIAATVVLGEALADEQLVLGPGYDALRWALDPSRSLLAIAALATLRVAGTAATLAGGGVGGLFIPLVIQGALVGSAVGGLFDPDHVTLFPVVGMAAFLGAGYRVPLAAVVFVAEFTGRPGFVVPGLIAAVVAQLVAGRASVSDYQVTGRGGHLERRLGLPVAVALDAEARTVPPDATVAELFWHHLVGGRQLSVAVVDGSTYVGIARAEDVGAVPQEEWGTTTVHAIARTDVPAASPAWHLADVVRVMHTEGVDRVAVCDDGRFIGVVTEEDLLRLDEVLDRTLPGVSPHS